jgi:iron complex transport system substrate-binding protein
MMRRALLAVACLAITACGPSSEQAPAVMTADAPLPRRIISIIPATTEMLFAMGAGDRVVAVGNYDRYPSDVEKLPRVGGLLDPNVEQLLALRPDLVVAYDTQEELKQELERAHIPVFRYSHQGLPDIAATMRALGERVGAKDGAEAAARAMEQQLEAVRTRVAGLTRPKTLLVFGREEGALRNIQASGGYGFLHDVLEIAGGTDVLTDLARQSVQMSTETLLARAPDVIIELRYGEPLPPDRLRAERQVWNALPALPAVRDNRIFLMVGDEFVVPGPRIGLAAQRFARALHPGLAP